MTASSSTSAAIKSLADHLDPMKTPKRILALDGGGIRGIVSLQYLRRIENLLRTRHQREDLVLADYFDLIGGTSTGAIIAAALAQGREVDWIEDRYRALAEEIFKPHWFRIGAIVPKFGSAVLVRHLQDTFGADVTFASPSIRTGLMVMTKRFDTGSPWPLTNHPHDPYARPIAGKRRVGTGNMLLWEVVRASTAAPHFFAPEDIEVGRWADLESGVLSVLSGLFVDGGVSTANNPSLQLLKIALLKGFAFEWMRGEQHLLLVSVGTGLKSPGRGYARGFAATAMPFAMSALASVMDDCNREVETVMQWLSESPTARRIDGQIGSLAGETLVSPPLLSYLRYNLQFDAPWLAQALPQHAADYSQRRLNRLQPMGQPGNMNELARLAQAVAAEQVQDDHFSPTFDC